MRNDSIMVDTCTVRQHATWCRVAHSCHLELLILSRQVFVRLCSNLPAVAMALILSLCNGMFSGAEKKGTAVETAASSVVDRTRAQRPVLLVLLRRRRHVPSRAAAAAASAFVVYLVWSKPAACRLPCLLCSFSRLPLWVILLCTRRDVSLGC